MERKPSESILFSGLGDDDLRLIEGAGNSLTADKGTFLFFQDDPSDRFYLVLSGRVRIFKTAADGKEQILMMAGPGDSFGEAALFSGKTYPASAEVVEAGEMMSFSRDSFMTLIRNNPTLAVNMIGRLSMLLHHLTRLVQQLSLEDVSTRLAGYLVGLLADPESPKSETVTLTEKKMFLASMLGTIPETLSRAFARLSQLGLISVEGQKITVYNCRQLSEFVSGQKI